MNAQEKALEHFARFSKTMRLTSLLSLLVMYITILIFHIVAGFEFGFLTNKLILNTWIGNQCFMFLWIQVLIYPLYAVSNRRNGRLPFKEECIRTLTEQEKKIIETALSCLSKDEIESFDVRVFVDSVNSPPNASVFNGFRRPLILITESDFFFPQPIIGAWLMHEYGHTRTPELTPPYIPLAVALTWLFLDISVVGIPIFIAFAAVIIWLRTRHKITGEYAADMFAAACLSPVQVAFSLHVVNELIIISIGPNGVIIAEKNESGSKKEWRKKLNKAMDLPVWLWMLMIMIQPVAFYFIGERLVYEFTQEHPSPLDREKLLRSLVKDTNDTLSNIPVSPKQEANTQEMLNRPVA